MKDRQAEGEREELKSKFSPDLFPLLSFFSKTLRFIPLIIHSVSAPYCVLHASLARKEKQPAHPTPKLKWWCSTCFLTTRESTEKVRLRERGQEDGGERERESKGLTAGWYSWGLTRETDGAEWTSPRNFNVDRMACCCQSQSSTLYITGLNIWLTSVCSIKQKLLRSVIINHIYAYV